MPGVQTLVSVMLNHVNEGKLTLEQFVNFVCENPIKIFGIRNKGYIKILRTDRENYPGQCGIAMSASFPEQ